MRILSNPLTYLLFFASITQSKHKGATMSFNYPKQMQRATRDFISIKKEDLQQATNEIANGAIESTFEAGNYSGIMRAHPLSWVKANKVWIYDKQSSIEVAQFFTKKRKINRNKWGAQNSTHNYWCEIV